MRKIYFAHPVNIYNEPLETSLIKLIASTLVGGSLSNIENPNQPCHQRGYDKWAKRQKESATKHRGMNYFYDVVLPECSGCAAVTFLDGRLGLGVAGESKWFLERQKPLWLVVPAHDLTPADLQEFTQNPYGGFFKVRFAAKDEQELILKSDSRVVIPHEETRLRTWRVYNREKRPYEGAHLVKMPVPEGFYPAG